MLNRVYNRVQITIGMDRDMFEALYKAYMLHKPSIRDGTTFEDVINHVIRNGI